ncbi:MAG: hypothetical protein R3208_12920, partial [Ketobacteraceae bacterium]|nr:hypothetical protein [Ketobacteraceae bacterium]
HARMLSLFVMTCFILGCSGENKPLMSPNSQSFFGMPWPNDIRKNPDGTIDIKGLKAFKNNLVARQVGTSGASITTGFGLHSPVHFAFSGALAADQFGTLSDTLSPASPVILVNIDKDSPRYLEQVPLKLDFDSSRSLFKEPNLLTLLPFPGYSLDADTTYAAILFNGIKDTEQNPVVRSDLLDLLDQPYDASLGLSETDFNALANQKRIVEDYVSQHTPWQPGDILAFTYYTTQDPTADAHKLADHVREITDQRIIDSVQSLSVDTSWGYSSCGYRVRLLGELEMPKWQHGKAPYLFSGGYLKFDQNNKVIQNGTERVDFSITIGCEQPTTGKGRPIVVFADGTGADGKSSDLAVGYAGWSTIGVSVTPHQSDSRLDATAESLGEFLKTLNIGLLDTETISGVVYYNYLNPAGAVGNQLQSAAEQIYMKRVAKNIAPIMDKFGLDIQQLNLPADALDLREDYAVIMGQSQGSGIGPLVLAMDHDFKAAYFNAMPTLSRAQLLYRKSVRELVNFLLLGIDKNELDEFHPVVSALETFHDTANGLSYASQFNTDHILITAGYEDGCVPIEGALPMAFALSRYDRLQPALTNVTHVPGLFDPYNELLGVDTQWFPIITPNLPGDGVGLFVPDYSGHFTDNVETLISKFLRYATGELPLRLNGPYDDVLGNDCDERYSKWEYVQ